MNNRAFTISFIVAILAVSMVYSYVTSTEETLKQNYGAETSVVVAKGDIRELDILNETNLTLVSVPKNYIQPGATAKIEDLTGALAVAPIQKGEQITRSKVTQLGTRTGLSRQVAMGKRAVTVSVNDATGVARLIKPGDRVDVLAKIEPQAGRKDLIQIRTFLQDVLVLATGKYIANTVPGILESDPLTKGARQKVNLTEYNTYTNVTLEVDPVQAQQMAYIQSALDGIILSLRNNDDNGKEDLPNVTMADILGPGGQVQFQKPGPQPASAPPQAAPQPNSGFQLLPQAGGRK